MTSPYFYNAELGIYEREQSGGFNYNDGDEVESRIYHLVSNATDVSDGSDELISYAVDWPTFYHFSPARTNLLRPLRSKIKGRVLELGSGCGAISRFLGELKTELTCVEGSLRRASITASRCRGLSNVKVVNDNFENFVPDGKFDIVTLIGVLEYSRVFIKGEDPIQKALALAMSFLKEDGVLIIAIENKLGLKYFAGAPEDHLGIAYSGLESLYGSDTVVTFGRNELKSILKKSGFHDVDFLYPFPDYKLPTLVLTEDALQLKKEILNNILITQAAPNQTYNYQRNFSEGASYEALIENDLVGHLSNSFLVLAKKNKPGISHDFYAAIYSSSRKKEFRKEILIGEVSSQLSVSRGMIDFDQKIPACMSFKSVEKLVPGELYFNRLFKIVNREGWSIHDLALWVKPWAQVLESRSTRKNNRDMLNGRDFDLTPFNLLVESSGDSHVIDLEWSFDDLVSFDFVLVRGIFHSLLRLGTVAQPANQTPYKIVNIIAEIIASLYTRKFDIVDCLRQEVDFMRIVTHNEPCIETMLSAALEVRHSANNLIEELNRSNSRIESLLLEKQELLSVTDNGLPGNLFKIAVVLHLFYVEQFNDFIVDKLSCLPDGFDLIVTTTHDKLDEVNSAVLNRYPNARIFCFENRGRDIGPLIQLLDIVDFKEYDYVCKIHSKKSDHLEEGLASDWLDSIYKSLTPSKSGVSSILAFFSKYKEVGILSDSALLLNSKFSVGGNHLLISKLASRLGLDLGDIEYSFPAGSMFWCRGIVLDYLKILQLTIDNFEIESGQTNGTLAHVVERVFPLVAFSINLLTVDLRYDGSLKNPRLSNFAEDYTRWLNLQKLDIFEAKLNDQYQHINPSKKVLICIIDRFGVTKEVIDSLNSITNQLYSNVSIMICSVRPELVKSNNITWIEPKDHLYSAALEYFQLQDAEYICLLEAGDMFSQSGLLLAMNQISNIDECKVVYFDDDILSTESIPTHPRFKPDFDLNLLRSIPYADGFLIVHKSATACLKNNGIEYWGGEQIAIIFACFENYGASSIKHVSEIIGHLLINSSRNLLSNERNQSFKNLVDAHFLKLNIRAQLIPSVVIEGSYRVKYFSDNQPLVSIIIPTKNQLLILQRCVESILEKTTYHNYEILVVDNNSDDPNVSVYLTKLAELLPNKVRIFSYPHAFNFSAINNAAVAQASGEYLVLLNNDTAIIQHDWIEEMLNHALRPEVGAVGAKLLFPNGLIQHAGVVMGLRGPADHPMIGSQLSASGYMHRLQLDQRYSAVTAACMMVRKSVYLQCGGMDEQKFKVSYNDVDLCLKIGKAGFDIVWTPFVKVLHEGSVSQTKIDPEKQKEKNERFESEQFAMYGKWLDVISCDPFYNKNLTLSGNGFELENRVYLTWKPLTWKPVPRLLCHAADEMGCGQYRIYQPFKALKDSLLICGDVGYELLPPFELAKYKPDVMVFQRQITGSQIDFLRKSKICHPSYKIYELDDYLPNLPMKSMHKADMPRDIIKSLRKALTMVDRFVVSTDELASAYSDLHGNIHVVNNYLPSDIWGDLKSNRRQSVKPRVGWGGGASHTGDLELIADVIKELSQEVEWVFFGLCPDKIRPFVHEYHDGVPIEQYPAKLASLNLDLALAPLESNLFNKCKSNLRLLEYGACGFPVICSDVEAFAGNYPVIKVKNRHKDWTDAIRAAINDLDATAALGDELKSVVLSNWMLEGNNLNAWLKAWLPS